MLGTGWSGGAAQRGWHGTHLARELADVGLAQWRGHQLVGQEHELLAVVGDERVVVVIVELVVLLAECEHDLEHELGGDVEAVSKETHLVHLGHAAGDCLQADRLGDLELRQRRDLAQRVIVIRPPLIGLLARERCCR